MECLRALYRTVSANCLAPIRISLLRRWHRAGPHYCPVCESRPRRFLPHGDPIRLNARCPVCRSLERHRLDWLFLQWKTNLLDNQPKSFLHIAPEKFFTRKLLTIDNLDYLSADLANPRAMVKMDITRIAFEDHSFSAIYCSHVLEHIPNDKKALRELQRVLKTGGWAVLQVPLTADKTYEDPAIITPEERKKVFGQWDHVRVCGLDYAGRIEEAGFSVHVYHAADFLTPGDCHRMGCKLSDVIFYCQKA